MKKYRNLNGLFVAEGRKVVPELIRSGFKVRQIYALRQWLDENRFNKNIEVTEITQQELEKISSLSTPNEVLALIEKPEYKEPEYDEIKGRLSIALEDIQDPGNLGTIIRIADWFGIEFVFCSNECVDVFNSKVVQATMGSLARVKIVYVGMPDFIKSVKDKIPVYGAALGGENIYSKNLETNGIILFGNESKGISGELSQLLKEKIEIPRFGGAESLNVGIAAAIFCSEFRRRS